jgi:DNA-binding CsgD family transcriptional regulator
MSTQPDAVRRFRLPAGQDDTRRGDVAASATEARRLPEVPSELTALALEGVFEEPKWSKFLEALRLSVEADYAALIFRPLGLDQNQFKHFFACNYNTPSVHEAYWTHGYRTDPVPYYGLVDGRAYSLPEILSPDNRDHREYVETVLRPSGVSSMLLMRITAPGGIDAWLNVSRNALGFDREAASRLEGLAPSLRIALRYFFELEARRTDDLAKAAAVKRLNFGWVALDASGRILDCDAFAERVLAERSILYRSHSGALAACSARLSKEMLATIERVARSPNAKSCAMILNRDPWLDLLLVPAGDLKASARSVPAVIGYIHEDSCMSSDRHEQLAQLFSLSTNEAKVALSLSRGLNLTEIADELNLKLNTVRTYSKRVFEKVGARGQADLVRIIYQSVLTIS